MPVTVTACNGKKKKKEKKDHFKMGLFLHGSLKENLGTAQHSQHNANDQA